MSEKPGQIGDWTDSLRVIGSRRYGTLSPLRYPGGKAALAGFFADIIDILGIKDARYIEPYAGGVGAGIALLREGIVQHLVVNDIDPAVHAFWKSVVGNNAEFVEMVASTPLTIDEWQRQREVYRSRDERDALRLGFALFFLNRTNRSGILNAGVIGGQRQGPARGVVLHPVLDAVPTCRACADKHSLRLLALGNVRQGAS
jgi:DNA adenine methylase